METVSRPYPHPVPPGAVLIPEDLIRSVNNDRSRFDAEALQALADSIAAAGVKFPPIVRRMCVDGEPLEWVALVAGDRRTRACRLNGYAEIPCIVTDETPSDSRVTMLVENLFREPLDLIEEANAYQARMEEFGWEVPEVAKAHGVREARVKKALPLLDLLPEIQQLVRTSDLAAPFAFALSAGRLDTNRQRAAIRFLNTAGRKATVALFKAEIGRLGAEQAQESLLTDEFLVTDTGPAAAVALDLSDLEDPLMLDVGTGGTLEDAAVFVDLWRETAGSYTRRGRTRKQKEAEVAAAAVAQVLAFLAARRQPAQLGGAA